MDEKKLLTADLNKLMQQVVVELEQLEYQKLMRATFLLALKNEKKALEEGPDA